ncbi:MAG: rRNA maturation RNase YbeY [Anaerolineae bacterium]|nr:rRNA maturation RNase YbeY [Anaerolineae bacterium]
MIHFITREKSFTRLKKMRLRRAARTALRFLNRNPGQTEISIIFVGSEEMQHLNASYREVDKTTDVLSFTEDYMNPESGRNYLGDIVICYPVVVEQSAAAGHSINTEAMVLMVHGILHLMGYDHVLPDEKEKMWQKQEEIFVRIGLQPKQLPES